MKSPALDIKIRFFLSTGYLKLDDPVPDTIVDRMRQIISRALESQEPPYRVNGVGRPCRVDGLLDRDPIFVQALKLPPIIAVLTALLGPNVEILRFRHNHATVNAAGDIPFRLHRDVQSWSRPLVSVFFYLEDATVENGCTHIVPGSHTVPYVGPQSGGGAGNWADEHDELSSLIGQELPIPMRRGGVLFVNSLTLHSVGRNHGSKTRLSAVFAGRSMDDLAVTRDDSAVIIAGQHRFAGNPVLPVSGSLLDPQQ